MIQHKWSLIWWSQLDEEFEEINELDMCFLETVNIISLIITNSTIVSYTKQEKKEIKI